MKTNIIFCLGCAGALALTGVGCGTDPATQVPTTQVDSGVWNTAVTTLVVEDHGGGFAPQPPPGSACTISAKKFTLTVATRKLDWTRCVSSGTTTPYTVDAGSRVITDAELKDLGSVLGNLRVVKGSDGCSADATMLTVDVTNPVSSQEYVSDDFHCTVTDKPYIARDAIAAAIDGFNKLAGTTS